ncbi:phosphotransferase [Cupriavidus necator]|nr:phosphotransferase [Cupriavidus necator]MDX6008744.1 phosphotransferase [Cupriavidus necator]
MDALIEWLPLDIPAEDSCAIVRGDFRCDNMIFHPTNSEVVAVLDWELSTLGDPLADFAYQAMMYRMPPSIVAGLAGADLKALNIPSEEKYVRDYCTRTGRTDIESWPFYIAFNFFRMVAIFHGIKGRVLRGTAVSVHARDRAASFTVLAELAYRSMKECQ